MLRTCTYDHETNSCRQHGHSNWYFGNIWFRLSGMLWSLDLSHSKLTNHFNMQSLWKTWAHSLLELQHSFSCTLYCIKQMAQNTGTSRASTPMNVPSFVASQQLATKIALFLEISLHLVSGIAIWICNSSLSILEHPCTGHSHVSLSLDWWSDFIKWVLVKVFRTFHWALEKRR